MYPRGLHPSVLAFSLSLYRHPIICILCTSRFTSYNKQKTGGFRPVDSQIDFLHRELESLDIPRSMYGYRERSPFLQRVFIPLTNTRRWTLSDRLPSLQRSIKIQDGMIISPSNSQGTVRVIYWYSKINVVHSNRLYILCHDRHTIQWRMSLTVLTLFWNWNWSSVGTRSRRTEMIFTVRTSTTTTPYPHLRQCTDRRPPHPNPFSVSCPIYLYVPTTLELTHVESL